MHRRIFIAFGLIGFALIGWLVARPVSIAQSNGDVGTKLPVKKVVLFSSGVGYFQRAGDVDGNAKVDLSFSAGDINDLLKSLTLEDQGGGRVQAVGYDSHDPVERTLKSYAIDLSDNPSQAQILDRTRGEKVEVSLVTGGQAIVGSIVGIERSEIPVKDGGKATVEQLNVLTGEGMRSARLPDIHRIRFLNPSLDSELRKALDTLGSSHDTAKKTVSLKFAGNGRRPVRVSYVVESPIWKTSYRLVLDAKNKPFLQGWAVIENPTDEDWSDVKMSLVSGRPISFKMDLYSPLYLNRPLVEPELFASLRPPTYDGPMERNRAESLARANIATPMPAPAAPGAGGGFGGGEGKSGAPRDHAKRTYQDQDGAVLAEKEHLQLGQSVASAASGSKLGDYFQYSLDETVSVARQKSAMLPIVNKEIEGTKVSIYNPRTHAKYPLLGLKFKNSSDLSLMQGPVTVFDAATYAGDARLPDVQPNEERLISYAIDLGTEVESNFKQAPVQYTTVKIAKGILHANRKLHEERHYAAVNRSQSERTLLIEHPFRAEYTLVGNTPKPLERTRDLYRFGVKLPAGQKGEIDVIEERDLDQAMELVGTDPNTILFFIRMPSISPKVKAALEEAMGLRSKWTDTQRELASVNKQLADITKEQERLRANLKELPPTAAAYKRYLEKFDTQETQIEKLQADQKRLSESETQARARFEHFVSNLSVE